MKKDFWKGFLVGMSVSLFVCYSFFRIYWILEIGVKYFRWHATLWLYLSIALVFAGISYLLYKSGKLKSSLWQKIYLVAFGLFAGIYLTEIFLRLSETGITYSEQREGVFVNPAERTQRAWYITWQPNETINLGTGKEYSFERHANSLGLSDKEWTTHKDSSEIRIITLGDSFTEGDGAAADSCYPRLLEYLLQKRFPQFKINVMNAGRCGSDPWFEYKKLHDLLLPYHPDMVIFTNGSNDLLFDHLIYGGMERFAADSTVKSKIPQHAWLGLYEVSYVFRLLTTYFGYDETLFSNNAREENKTQAISDSKLLSKQYSRLATENNFRCIQLLRPDKRELQDGVYDFNLKELLSGSDTLKNYSTFALLPFYRDSMHITEENAKDYFWLIDGHHNAKGYAAMAQGVYSFISPELERIIKASHNR